MRVDRHDGEGEGEGRRADGTVNYAARGRKEGLDEQATDGKDKLLKCASGMQWSSRVPRPILHPPDPISQTASSSPGPRFNAWRLALACSIQQQ